jgi:hypothetical protein
VASQVVNPDISAKIDNFYEKPEGVSVLHEVLEAYIGALDNPGAKASTIGESEANASPEYLNAHKKADAIDPRHKDPNISVDQATKQVFISKFPYSEDKVIKALNLTIPLFTY